MTRIRVVSQTNGKRFERECEVLYQDHKILIIRPVPDKYNELFVFLAHRSTHELTNGFNVVLPGESIGVNLCEIGIPKASGQYKLAADGSASVEIDQVDCAATHKVLLRNFERKGLGKKGKKS